MVPHRVVVFIVVGASKIKAIESSLDDRTKMKRLLSETNDRGYKIVTSAARRYFLPCARRRFSRAAWLRSVLSRAVPSEVPFAESVVIFRSGSWSSKTSALTRGGENLLFAIAVKGGCRKYFWPLMSPKLRRVLYLQKSVGVFARPGSISTVAPQWRGHRLTPR